MYDFWETLLLDASLYGGNVMEPHFLLNKKVKLEPWYFDRWLLLFFQTLDENFEGPKVDEAKKRVQNIARIMQFKMEHINSPIQGIGKKKE